ncbi:MAG: DNA-directed DNA polymerase I [Candidatus Bathyarchaeia archaeon]
MSKKLEDYLIETQNDSVVSKKEEDMEKIQEKSLSSRVIDGDVDEAYLIAVNYDGEKHSAYSKLYDPKSHRVYTWYDNDGHLPYCFSIESPENLNKNSSLVSHSGFLRIESVEKYDGLMDKPVKVSKVIAKDPLAIGGRPSGCIRDMIEAWEADIKYFESYIYDLQLKPGMPYRVKNGKLEPIVSEFTGEAKEFVEKSFKDEAEEYKEKAIEWMRLLETPIPEFKRVAIDIEVFSPIATRVPDPREAEYPIICASAISSDGIKRVLLLKREGVKEGNRSIPEDIRLEYYESEKKLINAIFKVLSEYPVVLTFNGDDFDLRYLWHRASRLGFTREETPIELGRDSASLKYGIHLDLYKFFFNKSIQVYAFGQKYREITLDEVGKAILQMGKEEIALPVSELSYKELALYCFRDAEIVLNLTTLNENLVMKLIVILSRISFMPMEEITRQGVSSWIRSMLNNEHRKRNYLIPRPEDILKLKGKIATEAIIKGKKYKGAIVVEPIPGIHFNVAVLDFASLYPSIIRNWNLGYETILCPHEDPECRNNLVPGTPHWVCKKRRAIESILIGSLRDLRVNWYKPKSKDKALSPALRNLYSVVQNALKVVLNASYGVFGAERFAYYCPPVAEATAAIGRYAINRTIEQAESLGLKIFYGDTDSIFIGNPTHEQLKKLTEWSRDILKMDLEVDKNYRYLALSSRKKNYLGVYPDGSVDIKGLTGKKRHIPEFLKKAFYEMIEILSGVKSEEEFEEAKERIKEIIKKCYLDLKSRKHSLEDLAFSIMISKPPLRYTKTTPQHVKAAHLLTERGIEVKAGDIISFVKVVGEPGVKPVQLASKNEIDVEKYVEYINSTFEQVLDALEVEFNELIGLKKLDTFFL